MGDGFRKMIDALRRISTVKRRDDLKLILMVLLGLAAPIFLISYGWMMKQLWLSAPWWVLVPVFASHVAVFYGGSLAFDRKDAASAASLR